MKPEEARLQVPSSQQPAFSPKGLLIEGIDDSKKLIPSERFTIFQQILSLPDVDYGIGIIDVTDHRPGQYPSGNFSGDACSDFAFHKQPDYHPCRWE